MSLRQRVLGAVRERMRADPPSLRLAFWDGERFDFVPAPAVTIAIHDAAVLRRLALGDMSSLGNAYVRGDLTVEGAVRDVLHVGLKIADGVGHSRLVQRLAPLAARIPGRHSRRRDAENVAIHYDVSNEFYALWLEGEMIYSCAYFGDGTETIDVAQKRKLDHICRKLRLRPGDRLLDIGCGWGGLLRWAAMHYGVTGVGVTLSREQHDYACARIAAEGLADRIEVRLQDYRDVEDPEGFDRIVSVGMYEHVGIRNLGTYFSGMARLLRPGGIALNHGITAGDPNGHATGPAGGDFIDRYVFPGGEIPHLSRVVYEVSKAGLEVTDVEDLRPHYARTLSRWVERLEANAEAAQAAAGMQRYRIWRMYMAGMGYAFDRGWLRLAQVVAYKPESDVAMAARPWTREALYGGDAEATESAPDWS
ncbi:SAM-dependent methyltransferase [Lichenibacterium dinghuense]|uniref:SAM-dependent methyltransferase n=1 Tax=Lichenibacterium dinghuense TaxID=2895977 RepID=UPI001F2B0738|nr:cyclopropane-fatty-acyl-phospholipid synthase family protein [Lichenibacterium sp. 6Y81]